MNPKSHLFLHLSKFFFSLKKITSKKHFFHFYVFLSLVLFLSAGHAFGGDKITVNGKVVAYENSLTRKTGLTNISKEKALYLKVLKTFQGYESSQYLKVKYKNLEEYFFTRAFLLGKFAQELTLIREKKCDRWGGVRNVGKSIVITNSNEKLPRNINIPCYSLDIQSRPIKAYFVEEGKDIVPNNVKAVIFFGDGRKIELPFRKDHFVFPVNLESKEEVSLQLIWNGHEVTFPSISLGFFANRWVIGMDKYPFERDNKWMVSKEGIKRPLYYIELDPGDSEGRVRISQ